MAKDQKGKSTGKQYQVPLFADVDVNALSIVTTVPSEQADKIKIESLNFDDLNRPRSCLEVDFPILKVNEVAALEVDPPCKKPIYMMSKWWARRSSAVFRALCTSAALKAPTQESQAAQLVWSQMYRKSIKKTRLFEGLKLLDIFMGGGTTVVEAGRLGFEVTGVDLNPVAWWIVHNEVHTVSPESIDEFSLYIRNKVEPQILPFYTMESPWGFPSNWTDKNTGKAPKKVPIEMSPDERLDLSYEGPENIYTFWMKHIMCSDPACFHLTPQADSAIIAEKKATIEYHDNCVCPHCGDAFDLELENFRMAPAAKFVRDEDAAAWSALDFSGKVKCPSCDKKLDLDWIANQQKKRGKPKKKKVIHFLLLPKKWLKGITAKSKTQYGGVYGSSSEEDELWFRDRSDGLHLIEVRDKIPDSLNHSNFSQSSSNSLVCGKCGRLQVPLDSIKMTGKLAPVFPYLSQGYDPEAKRRGLPYNGKFFAVPDFKQLLACFDELKSREDLKEFIPSEALFYGFKTHFWGIPDHGYTHWYKMFNPRQLYAHAMLVREITEAPEDVAQSVLKSQMLGAFQNYLRQNCAFSFWSLHGDQLKGHFSNNNYHPKATIVENSVFSEVGSGNFNSCVGLVREGMAFAKAPYERRLSVESEKGKSQKVPSDDWVDPSKITLLCQSSTDLRGKIPTASIDLVISDPPFGDNVQYAELADFFSVWLKKPLQKIFPEVFNSPESPKTLEAVTNKARYPGEDEGGNKKADVMYDRLLTLCWKEASRVLKPAGLMAFTFHHDKDVAWVGVLDSLFKAGFYIESTFPIRSDVSKGDGDFGAQKIEFDIVHVCRKRVKDVEPIYWATLRRRILESVNAKSLVLAQHRKAGLHLADLEVIIRGEVLEQYSEHYGSVQKNLAGEPMSVREILIEANSIAQSLLTRSDDDRIPDGVDAETRVLLSLFSEGPSIDFDAARKRLKGSGVTLEELVGYGWVEIVRQGGVKSAKLVSISDRWNSLSRKRSLNSDLDQAHFAINCCLGHRQLDGKAADWEAWINENFKSLIPSIGPILKFIEGNHFGSDYKQAIGIAHRTLERTLQRIKETDGEFKKASDQMSLFDDKEV